LRKRSDNENAHYQETVADEREKVDTLKAGEIDFSDLQEEGKAFFNRTVLRHPDDEKTAVTIRLDRQVLGWFKAKGPGYQTRINALLRAYMEAHKGGR
jgi:uncharacterized protein (DUF4415 family)